VIAGNIAKAIAQCEVKFVGLLSNTSPFKEVFFQLKSQQFVEMIRSQQPTEQILHFARVELAPFGFLGQSFMERLQDLIALTAYADPFTSPVASYLELTRRETIADSLNLCILREEFFIFSVVTLSRPPPLIPSFLLFQNTALLASPGR